MRPRGGAVRPAHLLPAAAWAALLGISLAAGSARASAPPAAGVQLLGPARPAPAGEVFAGELRIVPELDGSLSGLRIEGDGWREVSWRLPPEAAAARRGAPLLVGFEALAIDPERPLVVVFEMAGHRVRTSLDLSAPHLKRMTEAAAVAQGPDVPVPVVIAGLARPKPLDTADAAFPAEADKSPAGWDIRVTGSFRYRRDDGLTTGGDGVSVLIKDEDVGSSQTLASVVTGPDGFFDVTFHWTEQLGDAEPDLYVLFRAANSEVTVQDATWGLTYEWRTGTERNFTGSYLGLGPLEPSDEDEHCTLHALNSVVRTWRWLAGFGYDCPPVTVKMASSGDDAWYVPILRWIHVDWGRRWQEDVYSHEYGHHFMDEFAESPTPDYCNDICDRNPILLDCGHCLWCREDGHIHFTEGVPDYLSDVVPDTYAATYGLAASHHADFDTIAVCQEDGLLHDPLWTEGFVAALLVDIHDSAQDDDPAYPGLRDTLALGADEILETIADDHPTDVMAFLGDFLGRHPAYKEMLWQTARNNGYEMDTTPPGSPVDLASPTHPVGLTSANAEPTFTWLRPADDASGILGYGYVVSTSPTMPSNVLRIGDVTTATLPPLTPATWYFNLRAVDRAGHWATTYASYGPFTIREAIPANLVFETRTGWDYAVVPRNTTGATGTSCALTSTLPGWTAATYWNSAGRNTGDLSTEETVRLDLMVDGVYTSVYNWAAVAGLTSFYQVNRGPINVHGGRHTLSGRFDPLGTIPELDETDNRWGRQFVWTPQVLATGTPVTKAAPPVMNGGWDTLPGGAGYYNADGFNFSTTGWWTAVLLRPFDEANDYDLRLHSPSTGSTSGFATNLATSARGAGCLDAVIVNKNVLGDGSWDAGVINLLGGTGGYTVEKVASVEISLGDSITYAWSADTFLMLREVSVPTAGTPVSVNVRTVPPTAGFQFAWYDRAFSRDRLAGWSLQGQTGEDGTGSLQLTADIGYHCVALFRDPKDIYGSLSVTLEVQRTPPDLVPHLAAGWRAPLVPRPLADGTHASVPEPDTLHGNVMQTYLNQASANIGLSDAGNMLSQIYLDGIALCGVLYPTFPAGEIAYMNWIVPYPVRGGRHSLALFQDSPRRIEEIDEDNNLYGEQWVWSPLVVAPGDTLTREPPSGITTGWEYLTVGPVYYNCDGLRLADGPEMWRALAVMPRRGCDVDVRLHLPLAGAQNGFRGSLAGSRWASGVGDYVLVNDRLAPPGAYDAGVLQVGDAAPYSIDVAVSTSLGAPDGTYGPFPMMPGVLLDLHEVDLAAGPWAFLLEPTSDEVYFGMGLHPADRAFLGKSDVVEGCLSWFNEDSGAPLGFGAEIGTAGHYCLAVWKCLSKDRMQTGKYWLTIVPGITAVPGADGPPRVTCLASVRPNPCNPRAEVRFEMARQGRVTLAVYDLKGRLVRELAGGEWPAGRHAVAWDGTDATGRACGSGVYLVRLRAGDVVESGKLTLVR